MRTRNPICGLRRRSRDASLLVQPCVFRIPTQPKTIADRIRHRRLALKLTLQKHIRKQWASTNAAGVDDEIHHKYHSEYLKGPVIPIIRELTAFKVIDGYPVFVISGRTPLSRRKLFVELALVAQRSMQDYPAGYDGTVDEADQTMLVLADGENAIGMVLVAISSPFWSMSWSKEGLARLDSPIPLQKPLRTVARIWTAASYRRRKLASSLLRETANYYKLACEELGWELPLTKVGASLLRTVVPGRWLGRGDAFALQQTLEEYGAIEIPNRASRTRNSS